MRWVLEEGMDQPLAHYAWRGVPMRCVPACVCVCACVCIIAWRGGGVFGAACKCGVHEFGLLQHSYHKPSFIKHQ